MDSKRGSSMNSTTHIIYLIILASIPASLISEVQITLADLQKYATQVPEFPKSDNLNWIDPNYTSFNSSITPSFFGRIMQKLHLQEPLAITPEGFKQLLDDVTKKRIDEKLHEKPIISLNCTDATRFFIWGAVHGAYHSLVRCLTWLHEQQIIDENLHMKDSNHYIIFNGDTISRSAYSMETLYIILALIQANPTNVFYITGNQEKEQYWRNFSFKRQLIIRARHLSKDVIPLAEQVDTFFNTLASIIYIRHVNDPKKVFLVYFPGIKTVNNPLLNDAYIASTKPGLIRYAQAKKAAPHAFDVRAIIRKEDWLKDKRAYNGLGFLDQSFGATNWSVLSSPIPVYREFYNFNYDAFVALDIATPIEHSTLTLYNRSIISDTKTFTQHTAFNIITGRPVTQKPAEPVGQDILIGSTMALRQGIPIVGQRLKQGIDIAINQQNRAGGIHGRHIRLDIRNDDFAPNVCRSNVDELIKAGYTILLAPLGDPTLAAYQDLLVDGSKLSVLFPVSGSPDFRKDTFKGLVHLFPTYTDGINAMVDYLVQEYSVKQFAAFYQDDASGIKPLQAAKDALTQNNIEKSLDLSYARGNVRFNDQIQKLKQAQIDAIGFFATSHATTEFIRQLDIEALTNKKLFGTFLLADASFKAFIKERGLTMLLGSQVPNPTLSTYPIIQEYRALLDQYNYPYDTFSLEGYMAAQLLIRLLLDSNGTITHEKVREKAAQLTEYDFGGFTLTFNKKTRSLAQYIWIQVGENREWLQKDLIIK